MQPVPNFFHVSICNKINKYNFIYRYKLCEQDKLKAKAFKTRF